MAAKNKPNEIYITRIYDAPVKAVWDAWTDPKQVALWWGPRGFTLTTHSKELKPGGQWRYTMHGPDGTDYPNITTYYEVEKYSRLVYDHGGNEERKALFHVTVDFTDLKGQTKMEMTMALATPEEAEQTKKFIKAAGGNSTWDRLAEYLEKESSGKESFVINRSFNATIEKVFEMWTNPKHFSQWLAPVGMSMEFTKAEIKEGGRCFYKMSNGQDLTFYGHINYLEIKKPNRIVYTQQFSDANGNLSRHPLMPTWPESMLTTVTFATEENLQTRVTVTWEPQGNISKVELEAFIKERGGMTQGWSGSFDKLDKYLLKI